MSSLGTMYFKKEVLQTILKVLEKKGEKGLEITISINDESNQYGQNISSWVSQSKEDRDNKKDRFFTSNGKIIWTDNKITKGEKPEEQQASTPPVDNPDDGSSDLPF